MTMRGSNTQLASLGSAETGLHVGEALPREVCLDSKIGKWVTTQKERRAWKLLAEKGPRDGLMRLGDVTQQHIGCLWVREPRRAIAALILIISISNSYWESFCGVCKAGSLQMAKTLLIWAIF